MNVLFVHFGDESIAGSEIALLELLRALPRAEVTPTVWCNGRQMAEAVSALGIPVVRDDFAYFFHYGSPRFSPRRYSELVRKGAALIEQTGADLVHCNSGAPAQWMTPAAWVKRTPLLVWSHSPYIKRARYVMGLHLADRVVAVATAITGPLLDDGMEPSRISVVYNGFDEAAVLQGEAKALRKGLGIPKDAVVGAIVGSLIRRKGHDVLFEAMRLLETGGAPFYLLVVGDGPQETEFRALAAGLPCHFLGRREGVGAILRDAVDLLIVPSRQEAFGRVVVEAAFAGVPAIGSRVDGLPEAISEGETGLLVEPESPRRLAEAIALMSNDPVLRSRLGAAARDRARRLFSIDHSAKQMVEEYKATLARYSPRRSLRSNMRTLRPYLTLMTKSGKAAPIHGAGKGVPVQRKSEP